MASAGSGDDLPHDQMEPNDKGKKKINVSRRGRRPKKTRVVVEGPWYPPPNTASDDDDDYYGEGPSTMDRPFVALSNVDPPVVGADGIRTYNVDGELVEVTEDGRLVVQVVGNL